MALPGVQTAQLALTGDLLHFQATENLPNVSTCLTLTFSGKLKLLIHMAPLSYGRLTVLSLSRKGTVYQEMG